MLNYDEQVNYREPAIFPPSLWFPVTIGVIFQQNTHVGFIDDEGQFGNWSAVSWVTIRISLPPPPHFEEACVAVHSSQFAEPCRMPHIIWMSVCGYAWGCEINVGIENLPHMKPFHVI
jgi:hypothetical protein